MSNVQHVIGFKAWLLFSFLFRARQACNQMQFIYRNDTTSTDHDKVSSLVWDKTPFMVSPKGWIESTSPWEVSVRVGSFHLLTFSSSEKLVALIKRANVDLDCWGQRADSMLWRERIHTLHYRALKNAVFMCHFIRKKATLSPVNYAHMQPLHSLLLEFSSNAGSHVYGTE